VLCAAFLYLHFGFVIFCQKNIGTKAVCKMLIEIYKRCQFPPALYASLFHTKVLWAAFIYLHFGFEIFWQKNIGAKAFCKMLM